MGKHWDHVFIGLTTKVMGLVQFVENVGHIAWRWRVDNGRGHDIYHVSMITVLSYTQLRIREELANGCQVNIAAGTSQYWRYQTPIALLP